MIILRREVFFVQYFIFEVLDSSSIVFFIRVYLAVIFMEVYRRDVFVDFVIVDDGVGVIGVEIIYANVLVI